MGDVVFYRSGWRRPRWALVEELARREAAVRQRIEELGERIAELNELLEAEEDQLSRLVITRETVEEVLGEGAGPAAERGSAEGPVEQGRPAGGAASPLGVMTVPPWRPGMTGSVLPQAYRDTVEILADAAAPMRAGQIVAALGLEDSAAKREALRTKLKRLVERGWATENEPGLFALAASVAGELTGAREGGDGITSSPAG